MTTTKTQELLNERKRLLEEKHRRFRENLPHIYGWKWYPWAKAFFESTNRINLLTAANQVSKSSTQIRKCIHWATSPKLWPRLWKTDPKIFWYLYPSKEVATIEFEKKWIPEFMPRGELKDHPIYGWTYEKSRKVIDAVHFNSGVSVFFKVYTQGPTVLQTSTVSAIFCDEEMPVELYDEIMFRLAATDGYFHMVFTATLGQEFWRRAIEGKGTDEVLLDAFKQQVTMYDCLTYTDGTPSPWTEERIQTIKNSCKSKNEVLRRVYGRFIMESGRKYPSFDPASHYVKPFSLPPNYRIYSAVDMGSGPPNHPAAIIFLAISPDNRQGYVVHGWRGDNQVTTAGDVLQKYREIKKEPPVRSRPIVQQSYDQGSKDFGIISTRAGEPFAPSDKRNTAGEEAINTLFKSNMLLIFDTEELRKLGGELIQLLVTTRKTHAKDDFIDALRYAVMSVPWDWSAADLAFLTEDNVETDKTEHKHMTEQELINLQIRERRGERVKYGDTEDKWGVMDEINEWNEMYGN